MKQEMRKLNRAKYAGSAEEMARLAAQGYVPVGKADPSDKAADRQDKKTAQPGTASGKKDKKAGQPAAVPDEKGSNAEQPAADPVQAVADGGSNGT